MNSVVLTVGGAVLGAVLTFIVAMNKNKRDDIQLLIDNLRKDNDELRQRVLDMERRIEQYEHEKFEQQKEITKLHAIIYARDAKPNP